MAATALSRPLAFLGGATARVRRTLAEIAVVLQVVIGGGVVLAAAERHSVLSSANRGAFTSWFAGPLHGLWSSLSRNPDVLHRDIHRALVAMLVLWLVIVLGGPGVRGAIVIPAVVVVDLLFFLCPPSGLTDLFNYIGYARLDVVHHLNPYVDVPLAQRGDPVYAYSNWHRLRSPYGPLFTLLMLPLAKLPLPVAYWTYKGLATAASLGLLAAVWGCARRVGRAPAAAVAMVGLNPLVLVYAMAGKHNDLLVMCCVMGGCLLLLTRREVLGGAALAAAVAIKASALFIAPVIALGAPRRLRSVAGMAAGGAVLATAAYLAFGPHLPNDAQQSRLVNRWSFPDLLGFAAGRGGADAEVRRIALVAMLAGAAICAGVAWRTRRWATAGGWAGLVALVGVSWLEPWYILWALPLAAVSASRTLRWVTVLMTAWLVLVWGNVVPPVLRDHGVRPGDTPVGIANRRYMLHLLEDHPKPVRIRSKMSGRARHSRRARILRRRRASVRPSSARRARAAPQAAARRPQRHAAAARRRTRAAR